MRNGLGRRGRGAGVPLISLSGAAEVADPKRAGKYLFKVGPNPVDSAAGIVAELHQQKLKTAALIATGDDYGDDGVATLGEALTNAGIQLVTTRRVATTATEFGQTVASAVARSRTRCSSGPVRRRLRRSPSRHGPATTRASSCSTPAPAAISSSRTRSPRRRRALS